MQQYPHTHTDTHTSAAVALHTVGYTVLTVGLGQATLAKMSMRAARGKVLGRVRFNVAACSHTKCGKHKL